jgi:hypothetical protein
MIFPQQIDFFHSMNDATSIEYSFSLWSLGILVPGLLTPLTISTYKTKPLHLEKAQCGTDQANRTLKSNMPECEPDDIIPLDADLPIGLYFRPKLQSRRLSAQFRSGALNENLSPVIIVHAAKGELPQLELHMTIGKRHSKSAPAGFELSSRSISIYACVRDSMWKTLLSLGAATKQDYLSDSDFHGSLGSLGVKFSKK